MTNSSDITIKALVKKKKELLDQLLVCSIHTIIDFQMKESILQKRVSLLSQLQKNDQAIKTREQIIGISAVHLEKDKYQEIERLLNSIFENNHSAISKLETDEKNADDERVTLNRTKKLSNYVQQAKSYKPKLPIKHSIFSSQSLKRVL